MTKSVLESDIDISREDQIELIPLSLHDSLMSRLDRLGDAKKIAQAAATLGRRFDRSLLMALNLVSAEELSQALSKLQSAELIYQDNKADSNQFFFKHALIQEVAYGSLLKRTRRTYHRQIADYLAQNRDRIAALEPEAIGRHYHLGENDVAALPFWHEAARKAKSRWAHSEAIAHLERALAGVAHMEDNREKQQLAITLRIDLAGSMRIVDDNRTALKLLDEAKIIAHDSEQPEFLSKIHHICGNLHFALGELEACEKEHQRSFELSQKYHQTAEMAAALSGLGDASFLYGRISSAEKYYADCVETCRQHDFTATLTSNLALCGHMRLYLGELDQGRVDSNDAVALAVSTQNKRGEMIARASCLAKILYDMAKFDEAMHQLETGLKIAHELGARRFVPLYEIFMARILYYQGHGKEAVNMAKSALNHSEQQDHSYVGAMSLGALALVSENTDDKKAFIGRGEDLLTRPCPAHNHLYFYRDAMEACLDMGDFDELYRLTDAFEKSLREKGIIWAEFFIQRARLLADINNGRQPASAKKKIATLLEEAHRRKFTLAARRMVELTED